MPSLADRRQRLRRRSPAGRAERGRRSRTRKRERRCRRDGRSGTRTLAAGVACAAVGTRRGCICLCTPICRQGTQLPGNIIFAATDRSGGRQPRKARGAHRGAVGRIRSWEMDLGASEQPRALAGTQACGNELSHAREFFFFGRLHGTCRAAPRKTAHLGSVGARSGWAQTRCNAALTTTTARQQRPTRDDRRLQKGGRAGGGSRLDPALGRVSISIRDRAAAAASKFHQATRHAERLIPRHDA